MRSGSKDTHNRLAKLTSSSRSISCYNISINNNRFAYVLHVILCEYLSKLIIFVPSSSTFTYEHMRMSKNARRNTNGTIGPLQNHHFIEDAIAFLIVQMLQCPGSANKKNPVKTIRIYFF